MQARMQARKTLIASLTLAGFCGLCAPAQAQQAQGTPTGSQPGYQQPGPDQNQAYPQQPYQAAPGQPYQPQPYQQPYQPQPYQPQPYQPQPYQPQPYQPQPYQPQPYQPQPYQPQPYYPAQPQPYYPAQPYRSPTGATFVPAPRGQARFVNRPRVGLIIAGAITLGVTWSFSALAAATYSAPYTVDYYGTGGPTYASTSSSLGDTTALWPLYIPVLGPWIEMGFLHGSGASVGGALLAFDGLAQAGGLAMLIAGAVTHTRVAVYARNNLQINPLTLVGGSGILVSGRF